MSLDEVKNLMCVKESKSENYVFINNNICNSAFSISIQGALPHVQLQQNPHESPQMNTATDFEMNNGINLNQTGLVTNQITQNQSQTVPIVNGQNEGRDPNAREQ